MNIEILSALLHFLHLEKFHEGSILDVGCGNGGASLPLTVSPLGSVNLRSIVSFIHFKSEICYVKEY